ncbi:cytochrome P450 [Streptomyces sp. NBRC 14336]|uniref:cytochrome P450 n=1 Tax=Streptomyces sp. NBRC 14336 TaxID=3030992 RepID=UPI0024A20768|nr:cytochrome P450 [Streptomyces sp. NBRC 14336]WBO80845.1 cytochrome P450 [Streptomyces sp. SBE_14.2]GLW48103.1 cytochrome P450 [Streptomyces sp. NBRC 14336]
MTAAPPAAPPAVDLTDPGTFLAGRDELTALWRTFRSGHPVHWHPVRDRAVPGFWVLSRYRDVLEVYRDNKRFTSERGNVLATLLEGGDSAAGRMLAVTDGRRHRDLRNVLLKAFAPRVLEPVVDGVRRRADRLVREAVARGDCDFAQDVAEHIPMATVADLLGVPAADRDYLLSLTKQALSSEEEGQAEEEALVARNELLLYFSDLAAERRDDPRDDVVSVLAAATIDGEPLTEQEIVFNCYSVIIGGDETSRLSMIGAMDELIRHPDQWRRLKDGDVTVESAVEEVLRWVTPAMHFGRRALTDVEIGGRTIRAGDVVTLWNVSANHDEEIFDTPEVFDLGRTSNKHVSFGYGPHFCLGAYLGRAEINGLLTALRTHVAEAVPTAPARPIHSNFLHGYSSLPVSLRPAR